MFCFRGDDVTWTETSETSETSESDKLRPGSNSWFLPEKLDGRDGAPFGHPFSPAAALIAESLAVKCQEGQRDKTLKFRRGAKGGNNLRDVMGGSTTVAPPVWAVYDQPI